MADLKISESASLVDLGTTLNSDALIPMSVEVVGGLGTAKVTLDEFTTYIEAVLPLGTIIGNGVIGGGVNRVLYVNSSGNLADNAKFKYLDNNLTLIAKDGTSAPVLTVRDSTDTGTQFEILGNGWIKGLTTNVYSDFAAQPRAEIGIGNTITSYGTSAILGNSNTVNLSAGGTTVVLGSDNSAVGGALSVIVVGNSNVGAGPGLIMFGTNNSNMIEKKQSIIIGHRIKMPNAGQNFYQIKMGTAGRVATSDIARSFQLYMNNTDNSDFFMSGKPNVVLANQTFIASATHYDVNATNTLTIHNGVAPTTNIANAYQSYASIVSGVAVLTLRNSDGTIINLARDTTSVASATYVNTGGGSAIYDNDTFDGYTIGQAIKTLRNRGFLA